MSKKLRGLVVVALLVAAIAALIPSAAAQDTVELRLWMHQNPAFIAANQALIDAFEAENPGVTIKLESFDYDVFIQTLQTSMAAGNEADIIEMFGSWVCAYTEQLTPMTDDIMSYAEAEELFFAAPLGGYYCDGALYGLPNEFNIEAGSALVSKAAFEEAGLEYPPTWENYDELIADAEALTQGGGMMSVAGWHFISPDAMGFHLLSGILQHGGNYWKEDGSGFNLQTPEARAVMEQMKSWVDAGVIDPYLYNGESNWVGTAFFSGQAAIGFIGPWMVPVGLADYPDFEFDYVRVPNYAGDEPRFVADSGWGKVVSKNSEHQAIAQEFVKFATANQEAALGWNIATGTVPALKSAAEAPELLDAMPWLVAPLSILDYGQYFGTLPDRDTVWYNIIYPHTLAMLQDIESIDEALAAMEEEINATFE